MRKHPVRLTGVELVQIELAARLWLKRLRGAKHEKARDRLKYHYLEFKAQLEEAAVIDTTGDVYLPKPGSCRMLFTKPRMEALISAILEVKAARLILHKSLDSGLMNLQFGVVEYDRQKEADGAA